LPLWFAVIEQVPAATRVTDAPATVQTAVVVDAKLTGNPELAVALSVAVEPTDPLPGAANVMVWVAWLTAKLWVTGTAAL
jgi:hypothetical protein